MEYEKLKEEVLKLKLTKEWIKISTGETIIDQERFVKNHIATIDNNRGVHQFLPYYNRLLKFYQIMIKQN